MKKVLVIGAGFLQDFVICKAKSMGYETLAVDGNPEAVGFRHADRYRAINIVDEKACLEYARAEKIDGVLKVTVLVFNVIKDATAYSLTVSGE